MSAERTIKLCQVIVLRWEGQYLTDLVNEYEEASRTRYTTEAGFWMDELLKENHRLNPVGKWDEEEQIIGNLDGLQRED